MTVRRNPFVLLGLNTEVDPREANRIFLQRLERLERIPSKEFSTRDLEWALGCFEEAARAHAKLDAFRPVDEARELAVQPRVRAMVPVVPLPRRTAVGDSVRAVEAALCLERIRRLFQLLDECIPEFVSTIDVNEGVALALERQRDAEVGTRTNSGTRSGGIGRGFLFGLRGRIVGESE